MIITGSSNLIVGANAAYTLDRDELATLPADDYFTDKEIWRDVSVTYKHQGSNQHSVINFKKGVDMANLSISAQAQTGVWELHRVSLRDHDGGEYNLQRSEIPAIATYDINVTLV